MWCWFDCWQVKVSSFSVSVTLDVIPRLLVFGRQGPFNHREQLPSTEKFKLSQLRLENRRSQFSLKSAPLAMGSPTHANVKFMAQP